MKVTSTEEYGIRCLLRVGMQRDGALVSAQTVADQEGLSVAYAQKLLRMLSQADLVTSHRGAAGGFALSRPVEQISLGDAVRALGGMLDVEGLCKNHTGNQHVCCHSDNCGLRPVWSCLSDFVLSTFDAIPLALMLRQEQDVARALQALKPAPVHLPLASS